MYGVRFGQWHTWDDWGIIRQNVDIPAPEPVRYVVEVPGRDGVLDVTSSITPEIKYRNRLISFEFHVKSGRWTELLSEIMSRIHGRNLVVVDDLDPDFYWMGFCEYNEFASDELTGTLTVTLDAAPYKRAKHMTERRIEGIGILTCKNDRMTVVPEITVTDAAQITFGDLSVNLSPGTHKVSNIRFTEGNNRLEIISAGTTTVRYRQGRL